MPLTLPRYEDLGVRIAPATPVNTAGAESGARMATSIADNINRLTTFAFDEANKQAKEEGIEYGVANAVTIDQIRKAQESGQPTPQVGDMSTTFGRAARAGSLFALEKSVEIEARNKIAELHATARAQEMSPTDYQKAMQDIITGYGSSVAAVSPHSAATVRASLATVASSQFIAYSDWHLQRQQAHQKIQAQVGIEGVIKGVDMMVQAGDRVDPTTGAVTTSEQILTGERNKILRWADAARDPELAKTKLKEFNDAVLTAKKNVIATATHDERGVPTSDAYFSVLNGTISDPTKSPAFASYPEDKQRRLMAAARIWNGMDENQRNETRDQIRTQMTNHFELESKMNTASDYQRSKRVNAAKVEAQKAFNTPGPEGEARLKLALEKLDMEGDAEGYAKYSSLAIDEGVNSDAYTLQMLKRRQVNGTLTEDDVVGFVNARRLGHKDAKDLIGNLSITRERNFDQAMIMVRNELGLPDKSIIRSLQSVEEREAEQKVANIQTKLIEAKRAKPDLDVYDMAKKEVADIKQVGPTQAEIDSARSRIGQLRLQLNLPATATYDQINQALTKAIESGNKSYENPSVSALYRSSLKTLMKIEGAAK